MDTKPQAWHFFGLIYFLIIKFTRKQLVSDGKKIAVESTNVIKSIQEGLGGIRDVLIDGSQSTYCQIYRRADLPLRRAQGNNFFISASPRFAMEALGMLLIAALAYSLAKEPDGLSKALPVLGALALGAQRLLPVMQQAYSSWTSIRGGQASLQDTLDLLDQPLPYDIDRTEIKALGFEKNIHLKDVWFRYHKDAPYALKQVNLIIQKGARVGFIGPTGSGKSTLLDLVMGLFEPTKGCLLIDDCTITKQTIEHGKNTFLMFLKLYF